MEVKKILAGLGVTVDLASGALPVYSPIDGSLIARLPQDDVKSVNQKIANAEEAFAAWREVPAPKRAEVIRVFSNELRAAKDQLGRLVTIECGKILEEGKGEVQEMIDICDFAVGLSRSFGGLTLPSERPQHLMHENWLPLGVIAVISAFNFPVAVWAWNFALAIICGNSVIWKPSEKTPLCALACAAIFAKAARECGLVVPKGLLELVIGDAGVGNIIVEDRRVAMVSATGSTRMGTQIAPVVAKRFGKCLLELGGNNAVIVTPSANQEIALSSILFGAVGTAGQRCTTTRRVFVHNSLYAEFFSRLQNIYKGLDKRIGNPLEKNTLVGPLIDKISYDNMQYAIEQAKKAGGVVFGGERVLVKDGNQDAYYVHPALVKVATQVPIVLQETFAPILYVMPYNTLEDAIALNNAVPQGLSSSIFTSNLSEAELFKQYSDCGIANVNIGTSGAEIGGAFGGEKETGGGREAGSDSWKNYMRRQTSTTYYGYLVPSLAQGIDFS